MILLTLLQEGFGGLLVAVCWFLVVLTSSQFSNSDQYIDVLAAKFRRKTSNSEGMLGRPGMISQVSKSCLGVMQLLRGLGK